MRRLVITVVLLVLAQYVLVPMVSNNVKHVVSAHNERTCKALNEC